MIRGYPTFHEPKHHRVGTADGVLVVTGAVIEGTAIEGWELAEMVSMVLRDEADVVEEVDDAQD